MRHARPDYERFQDPAGLIPEDEPVFLLRGKDVAAPPAVLFWANAAERVGAAADIVTAARQQAQRMQDWQELRGRQIPDLPPPNHVAAMEAQTGEPAVDSPPPGIPRRSYLPGNTPAEIAIRQAMLAVEEMPAHPLLTDAVNLLQQAREKVADFVDGPAPAPAPAILAAPPRDHITRKRLEEIVEGAFRFDDIHLTAYRIGEHVVKQLGIEIAEEG